MAKKKLLELIDWLIEIEVVKRMAKTCDPKYYKNQYLEYAFKHHKSFVCVVRTYAEMLKAGYAFTQDPNDLKHANRLVEYLNLYADSANLDAIHRLMEDLKEATHEVFLYFIGKFSGRFKGFRSLEAKIRKKIAYDEVYSYLLENLNKLPELITQEVERLATNPEDDSLSEISVPSSFSEKELVAIADHLRSKKAENTAKNPNRDLVGYRLIIDAFDKSTEETDLVDFIYKFVLSSQDFFTRRGFDIIEDKDYVKKPKVNNYKSYHYRVVIMGLVVLEIQIRTRLMHKNAEAGSAAYIKYKDTMIQNFLKQFLYEISGENTEMNEDIGLLKELLLPSTSWCFTPDAEIPATPADLKEFAEPDVIEAIFNN